MAGSDFTTPASNNSRIADANRSWQAACDGDVSDWNKANEFIVALIAECGAHGGATETFKVQWSDDGGQNWYDLGSTGKLIQGDTTVLTNCTSPVGSSSGCQTLEDSHEIEGANSCTLTTTGKTFVEAQVAVDPQGADDGTTYSFRLYSTTAGAPLGAVATELTTAAGVTEKGVGDTGGGSEAVLLERERGVTDGGGGSDSLLLERERDISDGGGGSEVLALLKIVPKSVGDAGGGSEALLKEREIPLAEAGGGSESWLKEREIQVSDTAGGVDAVAKEVPGEAQTRREWPWHYRRVG